MNAEAVIEQFRDWAGFMADAVVLDTETTGLNGEVIELAIVRVRDGEVLFDQRFRPVHPISLGATEIHGLTDADLADCPSFAERWHHIRYLLCRHRTPLIYNRAFDLDALCRSLDNTLPKWWANPDPATSDVRTGDPYSADHWTFAYISDRAKCVMEAYAPLAGNWTDWGGYRWAKLVDACAARGVETGDLKAHSALGDAMATVRLIQACAELEPEQFPWIGQEDEVFA